MMENLKKLIAYAVCSVAVLLSGACTSVETLADVDKISLDAGKSQEEKLYKIILTSLAEKEVKLALQVNDLPEISFVMIPGRDVTILGQLAGVKAPLYSNLLFCHIEQTLTLKISNLFAKICHRSVFAGITTLCGKVKNGAERYALNTVFQKI